MDLSIIIPAYNEEKRIGSTLQAYGSFFEKIRKSSGLNYEILVVINNTKDKTEEVVKTYRKKNKRIKFLNLKRGGKGYAVIEGFKDALSKSSNLIGFVDADLATSPESFYDLVRKINGYDGILASRYLKGSKNTPTMTFRRLFVSRIFNFIIRSLFLMTYRDTQCGAKLFKAEALKKTLTSLGMTQWAFDIELLYELSNKSYQIKEIPTVWKDIEGSKLRVVKTSLQMLLSIIQLRIIKSPFRKFLRPFKPMVMFIWKFLI